MSTFKVTPDSFRSNMLLVHVPSGTLYKLSDKYPNQFTAQLVFPVPERTLVHSFSWKDGETMFREPPDELVWAYQTAYMPDSPKPPAPPLDVIKRFLTYSFSPVSFDYDKLSHEEKKLCTREEFNQIIAWLHG